MLKVIFKANIKGHKIEERVEIDTDYIDVSNQYAIQAHIDKEHRQWLLGFDDGYEISE
jgi:hypothetical protein